MAFKFVCLAVLVAAVQAGLLPAAHYGAPLHKVLIAEKEAPAVYDFAYHVEDPHTGDSKSQQESRKDHLLHGQYSLLEADGHHRRQVAYSNLDEHSGLDVDFAYAVEDPHTGDSKSRKESRKGDVVHGEYSLIDADGHRRTVQYTADPHSGFQAVVHREPVQGHVVKAVPVAHHVAPVAYHAAPVAHHVVKSVHAAPAHVGLATVSYSGPAHNYHY